MCGRRSAALLCVTIGLTACAADACTIGIAAGTATADGRPLIWKTRDLEEEIPNAIVYDHSSAHGFIAVANSGQSEFVWMGVNDGGFAMVNALAYVGRDRAAEMSNGALMHRALGECVTVADFVALLERTNESGRITSGNFGVMDAAGTVAMFEVTPHAYERFDPPPGERAFLVRTNFMLGAAGEQSGRDRYDRSRVLIDGYIDGDSLSVRSVLRGQMRDLCDDAGEAWDLPVGERVQATWPYGYVDCERSICRSHSVSAVVMQGVLPHEPPALSAMWTLLGHPATAVAVPYLPVGPPPADAAGGVHAPLWTAAARLKEALLKPVYRATLIDTHALLDAQGGGLWARLRPVEERIAAAAQARLAVWREAPPAGNEVLAFEADLASQALEFLQSEAVSRAACAEFAVEPARGCAPLEVHFKDESLHDPHTFEWDLDGDGLIDSRLRDPVWEYSAPGVYSVALRVQNPWGGTELRRSRWIVSAGLPAAPSACRASEEQADAVSIGWSDNSEDELGFVLYRDERELALLPAETESYRDDEAVPGRRHLYRVQATNECGASAISDPAAGGLSLWMLSGPVPARESIRFSYAIPAGIRYTLDVFDPAGRIVARLAAGRGGSAAQTQAWSGHDGNGSRLPAGMYLLVLDVDGSRIVQRILLID